MATKVERVRVWLARARPCVNGFLGRHVSAARSPVLARRHRTVAKELAGALGSAAAWGPRERPIRGESKDSPISIC